MFIPNELKALSRWVCAWSNSKIPMQASQKKAASSVDPTTWTDFETAADAVNSGVYDYLGFVFDNDGIVGIDIDAGFDEDGLISDLAIDIMRVCHSFTEKSRSGRGVHIYLKGKLPFKGKNNGSGVEIYSSGRYFIVTGQKFVYSTLVENQEAIDYVVDKYFAFVEKETQNSDRTDTIYTPIYTTVKNGKISLAPEYPPILPGMRNISLTSLGGQLREQGYPNYYIYQELLRANKEACKPPLPVSEIEAIAESIFKYRRKK